MPASTFEKSIVARSSSGGCCNPCPKPQPMTSMIWGSSVINVRPRGQVLQLSPRRNEAVAIAREEGGAETDLLRGGDIAGEIRPDVQHLARVIAAPPRHRRRETASRTASWLSYRTIEPAKSRDRPPDRSPDPAAGAPLQLTQRKHCPSARRPWAIPRSATMRSASAAPG